jgi:protein gp37
VTSHAPAVEGLGAGVSVENAQATSRIAHLQRTNAAIRFLSVEPLIGPVGKLDLAGIEARAVSGSGPRRTDRPPPSAAGTS